MIRPLTSKLYREFNDDEPPPMTLRGVASVRDGKAYAVGAVSVIGGENFIIFGVKPEFDKRDIIRGWRALEKTLDEHKTYYAIIDRDLETAPDLLRHFNFSHVVDDLYVYGG